MLLFRSEESVAAWCETQKLPQRPLVSLSQLWQLAIHWYSNRLTIESRRPGPDDMTRIFNTLELVGPFWDPKSDQW